MIRQMIRSTRIEKKNQGKRPAFGRNVAFGDAEQMLLKFLKLRIGGR